MSQKTKRITRTGILLALALAVQFLKMPQFITGSAVNAILVIAAAAVGMVEGIIIGSITPIVAIMVGIIKPPMAPVIPFIIAGNISLVVIFHMLQKKNQYAAVGGAAVVKFLVLYGAVKLVLVNMLPGPVFEKVAVAFGVTQFFTAVVGGIVALLIVPFLKNYLDRQQNANM
ncbi:MAG: ECF transporter S component [Bacillota bacterium]